MLEARIVDTDGQTVKTVRADEADKAYFKGLAVNGFRLVCANPACSAPVIHVRDTTADGNTQHRVAHFRSDEIQDHIPGCDYRDDPHAKEQVKTFTDALAKGWPILVNINFTAGFSGLRNRFNALVNTDDSGLMDREVWKEKVGQDNKYLAVPARDITDILHYLELAKEQRGQAGLQQLWFNTHYAVQSCKRFVIADKALALSQLESEIIQRAHETRHTQNQYVTDTPRLFLLRTTDRQARIAVTQRLKNLYGQAVAMSTPTPHAIKLDMKLDGHTLSNQSLIDDGRNLWVVAAPLLARHQIDELNARQKAIERGFDVPVRQDPMFMHLRISKRVQYMAVDAVPLGRAAQQTVAAHTLPPRQLEMDLDGAPKPRPQGRGYVSGRRWRTPRRGGPA